MTFKRPLLVLIIALSAVPLSGAVYLVPSDAELVQVADAIATGRVDYLQPQINDTGAIETRVRVNISRGLKGPLTAGSPVEIVQPGGILGQRAMMVSDGPEFAVHEDVLLFLESGEDGLWRTWGLALGKFTFARAADGAAVLVRGSPHGDIFGFTADGRDHVEHARDARMFMQFVMQEVARGSGERAPLAPKRDGERQIEESDYLRRGNTLDSIVTRASVTTDSHVLPSAYTQGRFRWDRFARGTTVTFFASGTQPGYDWAGASQRALAAWTNEPGSLVLYSYGGSKSLPYAQDNQNAIVFNSATHVPAGAIAYAQWFADATHAFGGETWYSISEGDVVVRSGLTVSAAVFEEALAHELGHTLGFRHSNADQPYSTAAIMNASISGKYGTTLQAWDIDAARHVYPGSTSTPPASTTKFDPNGDGVISTADVFYLSNYLFAGGPAPPGGIAAGDANGNGTIEPADIFYLVNHLFAGGPAPVGS